MTRDDRPVQADGPDSAPPPSELTATLHANLSLLEVADPALLAALLADREAARHLIRPLGDRAAVVAPGQFDALLHRLRKLGHLPRTEQQ